MVREGALFAGVGMETATSNVRGFGSESSCEWHSSASPATVTAIAERMKLSQCLLGKLATEIYKPRSRVLSVVAGRLRYAVDDQQHQTMERSA